MISYIFSERNPKLSYFFRKGAFGLLAFRGACTIRGCAQCDYYSAGLLFDILPTTRQFMVVDVENNFSVNKYGFAK